MKRAYCWLCHNDHVPGRPCLPAPTRHLWCESSGTTHTCVKCSCVRFTVDERGRSTSHGADARYGEEGGFSQAKRKMPACTNDRPWPPVTA